MKRRHLILLLGGVSSGAMSVGTGAFSSVEADRGVSVNVVDDEDAYLGLEVENRIATVGRRAEVVEITNSFAADLSLNVTVDETNEVVESVAVGDEGPGDEFALDLAPGESEPVSITCGQVESASFTLDFSGETDGASVEKTRTFDEIDCPVSDVKFKGNGAVHVTGDFTGLSVTVVFEGGSEEVRSITSNDGDKAVLRPRGNGSGGDPIGRVVIGGTAFDRSDSASGGGGNASADGDS
jgi:hypothetical protein